MRRRNFLQFTPALLALATAPFCFATAGTGYTDLMPHFWATYDVALSKAFAERAQCLLNGFFVKHAEIYDGAGVKATQENVERWLRKFDLIAKDVRDLSLTIPGRVQAQLQSFQLSLPKFDAEVGHVYFMPSLFWFDGHLQPWRGAMPLFVGVDGIVHYHGANCDLTVFLNHELFHVYHAQQNSDLLLDPNPPIFVDLWTEGLAVYASQQMSPSAPLSHIIFDDETLVRASSSTVRKAAAGLLGCLESKTREHEQRYFLTGYVGDIPARMGYLVGFLIARKIATSSSLASMAKFGRSTVKALVVDGLLHIDDLPFESQEQVSAQEPFSSIGH